MNPTTRLYLTDDHLLEHEAVVIAVTPEALACDRSCVYPGGGGQPPDHGWIEADGAAPLAITGARADAAGIVWHVTAPTPVPDLVGRTVRVRVDAARRLALTRYHTVLHVLNTLVLRDYGGWITGVQIGVDYSRIDFKLEALSPALCAELEAKVNAVLAGHHALRAYTISETEFRARDDLRRTLEAEPPVVDGRVRIVEIAGFDAQACGGTHVHTTADLGRFTITRTENKGRVNKRLYVTLTLP